MIYELRTYTFHPGKISIWLDLAGEIGVPARGDTCGKLHGLWTAEFGHLNQGWHLWSYASLDERARLRAELLKNERWTKDFVPRVQPLLQRQDIRFLNPVVDLRAPATSSNIYEIRIYRTQPIMAAAWAQLLKSYLPAREKHSPIAGLWTGEAPQPNEVVHLWSYPDLNTRMKSRAAANADPEWQQFLSKSGQMLFEMQSTILVPAHFSPMK